MVGACIEEEQSTGNLYWHERDEEEGDDEDEDEVVCPEICFGVTPFGLREVGDICLDAPERGLDSFLCAETWLCASGSEP